MLTNTSNDIISEIKWSDIQNNIVEQLFKGPNGLVTQAVTAAASKALGEYGGAAASAVLQNVGMAFNLKNRSKTDPIRIVFQTTVADGEGYIDLDTGDATYGKVWRGSINATIKKPSEFSAYAMYVNGNTIQYGDSAFKYWFLEFGVSNIRVPLGPVPLDLTAAAGRVFQHMNQNGKGAPYVPDRNVNFGAGVKASFIDKSGGGILNLTVDLNLTILDKGFKMAMYGDVLAANQVIKTPSVEVAGKEMSATISKSLIIGEGSMIFSSIDKTFYTNAKVTTNTAPLLCAGGEFIAYITPDDWSISVGTRQEPFQAKLLCRDFVKMGGWFELNKSYLDLGLFQHVDIDIRSPWIGPRVCKVQAWSVFRYDFGLQTLVFWKPFKIKEAAVWLDVLAAVGADWKTPLKSGSITFAGINFGGNLIYVSEPEAVLSGKMYGNVTVLGLKIGVEMEAKKKFS